MRIVTWNVNGLRAALRKGFARHIEGLQPDVLMLQEIRVLPEQLPEEWRVPAGWNVAWNPAERKGYAGTATWARGMQETLGVGLGQSDPQGRVLLTRSAGITFANLYVPAGSSGAEAQARKDAWMEQMLPWAKGLLASGSPVVIAGDLNVAHTENDLFYSSSNKKNSGFLPHERAWFGALLELGFQDVLREQEGDQKGPYSWWSNRGKAREGNRGWRIDYLLCSKDLVGRVRRSSIHRPGGLEVSDHAPVILDLAD